MAPSPIPCRSTKGSKTCSRSSSLSPGRAEAGGPVAMVVAYASYSGLPAFQIPPIIRVHESSPFSFAAPLFHGFDAGSAGFAFRWEDVCGLGGRYGEGLADRGRWRDRGR